MKRMIVFISIIFVSCNSKNNSYESILKKLIVDSISCIGKSIPNDYISETEYKYSKKIEKYQNSSFEVFITLISDSSIVETCNINIFPSNFSETKYFYDLLLDYINDDSWEFIKNISKYKLPNGQLYQKDDIYFGIYEPTPMSIPLCFSKNISLNDFYENQPEMNFDINFYKNEIIEYRNFFDERQQITNILYLENTIPNDLCFLVCWDDNLRGYIYELYVFNKNNYIINKYLVGYGPKLNNYRNILMEKLPGNKIFNELIAYGDINNNGINEIFSYSLYPNLGYIFTIFEYNVIEDDFMECLLAPIFINFERPFSPVEYNGNGFRILEVIDNESIDLAWKEYTWNKDLKKYVKR
ncbi:MAG: hypothetical protein FWH35_02160 [Treponema sp.]|nr:hypothetical protein [Treponema sp.]